MVVSPPPRLCRPCTRHSPTDPAVTGMSCGHCEQAVEKNLAEIESVIMVKADHEKGTVTVHYKGERPNLNEVTLRVKNLGYEPGETWS